MNDESAIESEDPVPAPRNSIVVGHDGSDGANSALAQALELANQLHAPVVIARAWSIDTAPRPSNWEFGYVCSLEEYSAAVHEELVKDAKTIVGNFPAVSLDYRAVHSGAAKALIDLSRDARMLVVGSRGRGGFSELLLGSVTDKCVRLAACPVLVVRPRS